MQRIIRALASALSLSLILTAPGLLPYQAVAQTVGAARVAPAASASGVAGASIQTLGGASALLPAASLLPGLGLSVAPAAAPSLTVALSPAAVSAPARAATSLSPVSLQAAAVAARPVAARPVASALPALTAGAASLSAAAKTPSADAPRVALDGLFEGSHARPEALSVSALPAASRGSRLDPSSTRGPAAGPRWVKTLKGPDAKPETSLKRTLSVGFFGAIIPLVITMTALLIAHVLGYTPHPNYSGPGTMTAPTLVEALLLWGGAAIMAPISEEAIFRGGLQGTLAKLSRKLRLGSFLIPALITATLFTALHETADPVLFSTRMAQAMLFSYIYHKEGILASMAAHGFFNGLLALTLVFGALNAPLLMYLTVPAVLYFLYRSKKLLKNQEPAISSGALVPLRLSGTVSLILAGVLMLGYFFIMPNIIWPIGAVALFINGARKLQKKNP